MGRRSNRLAFNQSRVDVATNEVFQYQRDRNAFRPYSRGSFISLLLNTCTVCFVGFGGLFFLSFSLLIPRYMFTQHYNTSCRRVECCRYTFNTFK